MKRDLRITALLYAAASIPALAQTFSTLVDFDRINGSQPFISSLIRGNDGNFYGCTAYGGLGFPNAEGTVFSMTPSGTLTTLHSFSGNDGSLPEGTLIRRPVAISMGPPPTAAPIITVPSSNFRAGAH